VSVSLSEAGSSGVQATPVAMIIAVAMTMAPAAAARLLECFRKFRKLI
jgi:hypothetical protein